MRLDRSFFTAEVTVERRELLSNLVDARIVSGGGLGLFDSVFEYDFVNHVG